MDWVGIAREVEDAKPLSFLLLFGFVAITGFFMVYLAIAAVVCQSLITLLEDPRRGREIYMVCVWLL